MQIKRFEADDMTDALRLVKREFGDDAVILSAKEMRPGGFFSAWRKKRVEITAATDYPHGTVDACGDLDKARSREVEVESENDRVTLSTPNLAFMPLMSGEPSAHPVSTGRVEAEAGRSAVPVADAPTAEKAGSTHGNDTPAGHPSAAGNESQYSQTERRIADPFYRDLGSRKIIALVGPAGQGKSTTIAKLARHCQLAENKRVGVISFDRYRIAATDLLNKVADIMNLPFAVVHDTDQLRTVLEHQMQVDAVLIDTPGMGPNDPAMREEVRRLLQLADPDETHLVVNATVRPEVMDTIVDTFRPLGIDRLLFTQLDGFTCHPDLVKQIDQYRLPSSFLTDGADLAGDLEETTVDRLKRVGRQSDAAPDRVMAFPGSKRRNGLGTDDGDAATPFVANRNSELFHHRECKSVKRINAENITAFDSMEQAMLEGFKPCRACCDSMTIKKAAAGGLGFRRMQAV